jgi:hypothetical protein
LCLDHNLEKDLSSGCKAKSLVILIGSLTTIFGLASKYCWLSEGGAAVNPSNPPLAIIITNFFLLLTGLPSKFEAPARKTLPAPMVIPAELRKNVRLDIVMLSTSIYWQITK